ncbi:ArsR/SmtB family transcription factor [Spirillospora sp. CA-294931]|uniref:ArsR/SmtB family transcription factor n=1 Tax=Spirillospora sp. CA-294931 TaxID=3240042 RepID=UPI003D94F412
MDDGRVLEMITPVDTDTCHEPVDLVPMDRADAERAARMLKAVSDPTRLQLLSMIEASPDGEACVCDLTKPLGLTQPTVSHHLKILVDAGLLSRDKRGIWVWFAILPGRLDAIRALIA